MTKFQVFMLMLGVQILHGCLFGLIALINSNTHWEPVMALILGAPFIYGISVAFVIIRNAFKTTADYSDEGKFTMK